MRRLLPLILLISAAGASAYEGARRDETDGGVHVPQLTKPPQLVSSVEATFPREAQAAGLTAKVRLFITIGADGAVAEAIVPEPVGHGFDESAIDAVKQFKFTPAELDGVPAPVQVEYVYHFVLAEPDAGAAIDAGVDHLPVAHLVGRLVARGSRTRISGGTVRCSNQPEREGASSDDEGRFELEVLAGDCKVKVVANGFEAYETTETLKANERTEVVYYVRPKAVGFETVVRAEREKKEVVRRSIDRQELQKVPGSFGDPVRVIQNFPGVARAPFVSGALIVRGAQPSQTLTYLDGVEIPLLFHLGGGPSIVNGEFLDHIDFYPGGFGARYGRAVGGAVDVATRRGATDTWHGSAKVDPLDAALFIEAPLTDEISVAVAARRSYIDAILPSVLPKDPEGGTLLILPRYWDYQVRIDAGAKRGKNDDGKSQFSLMAFGSDDQLTLVATGGGLARDVNVNLHTTFHRIVGGWTYRQGNTRFKLTPYLGYDLATINFGFSDIRADQYTAGVRTDLEVDLNRHITLRAGTDIFYEHIDGSAELPVLSGAQFPSFPGAEPKAETQRISRSLDSLDTALYLESDFKLGALTLTPGVRASHAYLQRGQVRHALDPRLWARFALFPGTQLKGSVGLYSQPPDAFNMEPQPLGTPSLRHEWAFQSSLGVAQKITDDINIDVTGFFNRRFDNVSSPGPTTQNPNGSVTVDRFANNGLGRAYGLEVMLRHEITKNFFGWLAYTLSKSEVRTAGSSRDYVLGEFDQTHILTAIASYRLPWGFEVGGRFRYVTGRPKSPLNHQFDKLQLDSNNYQVTFGDPLSARVPDFHQLDLRIDKTFAFKTWSLGIYLDVQNVYNQANVEGTFYDYRFRTEFNVPGIPILPLLGAKATF